jgi:hypothetical protein
MLYVPSTGDPGRAGRRGEWKRISILKKDFSGSTEGHYLDFVSFFLIYAIHDYALPNGNGHFRWALGHYLEFVSFNGRMALQDFVECQLEVDTILALRR